MKKRLFVLWVSLALFACETAPPAIQQGPDAEVSFDGLHKVDNTQADAAWARPDIDLSGYSKIIIASAGIQYRQVRDRGSYSRTNSGPYFIDEDARAKFEALVGEVFREELSQIENLEIVCEPGPDVLQVTGALLDVVSFVPPEPVGARSYVFLSSVGEATLVLELADSETGTVLARSIDRRAAETTGADTLQWSNTVSNAQDIKRLARRWAVRLREGLDSIHQ